MKNNRNIGIFAHVDAGKTTLSEQLLLHTGAIRTKGSVDSGTAHTDLLPVERRRGISVQATCVQFSHGDILVNLIDTPGHVDFSAEIERSLWALDAAVIVVCAVEGVQPQTEVLYAAMREQKLPVIFFINKIDRIGADPQGVLGQIQRLLSKNAVDYTDPDAMTETLCDFDDDIMERYLGGETLEEREIRQKFAVLSRRGAVFPVLFGSALKDEGVEPLLDAIGDCFPEPDASDDLCGIIFAAKQDHTVGRGVWVRLFGGRLENRDAVTLPDGIDPTTGDAKTAQRKITQIQKPDGTPAGKLEAGDIAVVFGLGEVPIGTVLGNSENLPRKIEQGNLHTPVISVQAIPEKPEDMQALRQAFHTLTGEDPMLQAQFVKSLNELHLQVMGTIQLEVLEEVLRTRFQLSVHFTPPAIIYRETIAHGAEGFVAYVWPKPCWAVLKFLIRPAPRDSGVTYHSEVPVRTIKARYQHQVEQAIPLALRQGRSGWAVTDVDITLIDGGDHQFHTHPLDFIVATPMAIQDGLQRGGSVLLEPILDVRFHLPQDCVGKVMTDVLTMRGEVLDSISDGERVILNARIPVQTSLDYAVTLASATGGRGAMSRKLHGYRECPPELGATTPRRSVDPLDQSKYILAACSALEGGIFDME